MARATFRGTRVGRCALVVRHGEERVAEEAVVDEERARRRAGGVGAQLLLSESSMAPTAAASAADTAAAASAEGQRGEGGEAVCALRGVQRGADDDGLGGRRRPTRDDAHEGGKRGRTASVWAREGFEFGRQAGCERRGATRARPCLFFFCGASPRRPRERETRRLLRPGLVISSFLRASLQREGGFKRGRDHAPPRVDDGRPRAAGGRRRGPLPPRPAAGDRAVAGRGPQKGRGGASPPPTATAEGARGRRTRASRAGTGRAAGTPTRARSCTRTRSSGGRCRETAVPPPRRRAGRDARRRSPSAPPLRRTEARPSPGTRRRASSASARDARWPLCRAATSACATSARWPSGSPRSAPSAARSPSRCSASSHKGLRPLSTPPTRARPLSTPYGYAMNHVGWVGGVDEGGTPMEPLIFLCSCLGK